MLTILRLSTPGELADFVSFAVEMDDGEAASAALAVHRAGTLITDDRKARSVLTRDTPDTPLLTTSQLLKDWAGRARPDPRDLAQALLDIEDRARFRPGRHDPEVAWWQSARVVPTT